MEDKIYWLLLSFFVILGVVAKWSVSKEQAKRRETHEATQVLVREKFDHLYGCKLDQVLVGDDSEGIVALDTAPRRVVFWCADRLLSTYSPSDIVKVDVCESAPDKRGVLTVYLKIVVNDTNVPIREIHTLSSDYYVRKDSERYRKATQDALYWKALLGHTVKTGDNEDIVEPAVSKLSLESK